MTTIDTTVSSEQAVLPASVTWRWFMKRSALTVAILASGIVCACWLYAAAIPEGSTDTAPGAPAAIARAV